MRHNDQYRDYPQPPVPSKSRTTRRWMSSKAMTIEVEVDAANRIVQAPPIVRKFIGQDYWNLHRWMEKQGELRTMFL